MAINQFQYGQRYEKLLAQGLSNEEAHRQAMEFATIKPARQKPEKRHRKSPLARTLMKGRRTLRELYYGPETYLRESPAERRARVRLEKEYE